MPFQKGKSGNPGGRPKKDRILSDLLSRELEKLVDWEQVQLTGRELLARYLVQIALHGQVRVGEHVLKVVSLDDWFSVTRWIYEHLDGPARPDAADISEPLRVEFVHKVGYDPDERLN